MSLQGTSCVKGFRNLIEQRGKAGLGQFACKASIAEGRGWSPKIDPSRGHLCRSPETLPIEAGAILQTIQYAQTLQVAYCV